MVQEFKSDICDAEESVFLFQDEVGNGKVKDWKVEKIVVYPYMSSQLRIQVVKYSINAHLAPCHRAAL